MKTSTTCWHPMETAPRDGSRIILASKDDVFIARWQDGTQNDWPTGWRSSICVYDDADFLGWTPIPKPPTERVNARRKAQRRLEYIRGEIIAERISNGEIAELESLAAYIDPADTLLLEWAGVEEWTS